MLRNRSLQHPFPFAEGKKTRETCSWTNLCGKCPLKEAVLPYGWPGLEDNCASSPPHRPAVILPRFEPQGRPVAGRLQRPGSAAALPLGHIPGRRRRAGRRIASSQSGKLLLHPHYSQFLRVVSRVERGACVVLIQNKSPSVTGQSVKAVLSRTKASRLFSLGRWMEA